MSRQDQDLYDLLPAYVLGALEPEEKARVDRQLAAGDPDLEAELASWSQQMESLAETENPVTPSDTVRARLLREIDSASLSSPQTGTPTRSGWWVRAAAIITLAVLGWMAIENRSLREQVLSLTEHRGRLESEMTALAASLQSASEEVKQLRLAHLIVSAPKTQTVLLAGLEGAPTASGHTYVDPVGQRAVFYASSLPELDRDLTYQLWLIADGKPVSAGVFRLDEQGNATVLVGDIAPVATIQAWAVTIEPAGGVPQPTGAMVLKG